MQKRMNNMQKIDMRKEKIITIITVCEAIYFSEKWLVFPTLFIDKTPRIVNIASS